MSLKLSRSDKAIIYQLYPSTWPSGLRQMAEYIPQIAILFGSKAEFIEADYRNNLLGGEYQDSVLAHAKRNYAKYYIWLSPIFLSPWHDGGYDVADYCTIDPQFGTQEDFENFIKVASSYNIGVLLDLVPNHTSTEHPWFKRALDGDPKYLNYYVHTSEDLGWKSIFDTERNSKGEYISGPCFIPEMIPLNEQLVMKRTLPIPKYSNEAKEYFLHSFSKYQVDLDLTNDQVIDEFHKIMKFWKDKGVAGFRIDCAQFFAKDLAPQSIFGKIAGNGGIEREFDRKGNLEICHELFDPFDDLFIIGECGGATNHLIERYANIDNGPLSAVFDTNLVNTLDRSIFGIGPEKFSFNRWFKKHSARCTKHGYCACVENHDTPRFISRQSKGYSEVTPRKVADALFNTNPQCVCIYQGQEFGQVNPVLTEEEARQDPETNSKLNRLNPSQKIREEIASHKKGYISSNLDKYQAKKAYILNHSRQNARVLPDAIKDGIDGRTPHPDTKKRRQKIFFLYQFWIGSWKSRPWKRVVMRV